MPKLIILFVSLFMLFAADAQAYIGPGLGAGTIAVVLGVIASILLAIFGVIWYPMKRLLKKLKKSQSAKIDE